MSSRVVGHGRCPKCNREGSIVFKEISGRIYVYVKHGREWCYLGPLDRVDLSSILIDLRDYHISTTKLVDYVRVKWGTISMRIPVLFVIGLALLLAAYGIGIGDSSYGNYVLALVLLSTLSFLLAIAVYESTYTRLQGYTILSRIISKGLVPYALFTVVLVVCVIIATIPLVASIRLEFRIPLHTSPPDVETYAYISIVIPITSFIISSLIITYLSRPLISSLRKLIVYIIVSVTASYIIFFVIPLILHGIQVLVEPATFIHIATSVSVAFATTVAFIIMFTAALSVLKKIVKI